MLTITTTFLRSGKTTTLSTYGPYFDELMKFVNDKNHNTTDDINAIIDKFYSFSGDVSLIFLNYMYQNYYKEFIFYVNSDSKLDMEKLEKSVMDMLSTFSALGKSNFEYSYYYFIIMLFKNKKRGMNFVHAQIENVIIANEIHENIKDYEDYFDIKYYEDLYTLKDIKFVIKNYDSDFSDGFTNFIINKSIKFKSVDIYKMGIDITLKFIEINNKFKIGFIDYCITNNNKTLIYDYKLKECFNEEVIPYFNSSTIDETFYWIDNFSHKYLKDDFNSKMYKLLENKIRQDYNSFLSYLNLFIDSYPKIMDCDYILNMLIENSNKKDFCLFINLYKKIRKLESMVDTVPSSKVDKRDEF